MEMAKDPVCGMEVSNMNIRSQHMGSTFYFCSNECKAKFDKNPMQYMKGHESGHMHGGHGGHGCC